MLQMQVPDAASFVGQPKGSASSERSSTGERRKSARSSAARLAGMSVADSPAEMSVNRKGANGSEASALMLSATTRASRSCRSKPCTSARWDATASVLAPRLLRSIQQKSESIENIAAEDSDVLIDHEKLTTKGPA
jgi:hypothetical protein